MSHASPGQQQTPLTGVIIVGLDRPDLVSEVLSESPPIPNGHSVPLYLIDPDASRAAALVRAGVIDPEEPRLRVFAGADWATDLRTFLSARLECHLPRKIVASGDHVVPVARQVAACLEQLNREQSEQVRASRAALANRVGGRGNAYWAARYAQIEGGSLARILVITSRYTSFVQHACRDLVEAFSALGHDAQLVCEPDRHTTITPLLCLRAIERFDPDLIVVGNYPRVLLEHMIPGGCPHVCWIQDAMSHLFQPLPKAPAEMDFVAGHLFKRAAGLSGYGSDQRLAFPVPVSGSKFHASPIDRALSDRFDCDIAYVSHQSEPASVFHQRSLERFSALEREGVQRCHDRVVEIIAEWRRSVCDQTLASVKNELAAELAAAGDAARADALWSDYIHPLAERLIRHEMLEWAARIAREHGLRFRIFGSGWDRHPKLSDFAAGPVAHDGELRACYQLAGIHLHASVHGCAHQRVVECAMSGGLCVSRRSWGEMHRHDWYRMSLFLQGGHEPDACLIKWRKPAYSIENFPELKSIIEDRRRLPRPAHGWDHEGLGGAYALIEEHEMVLYWGAPVPPEQMRPVELLGDPLEMTFSTAEELEGLILRARDNQEWRTQRSRAIAGTARERISMDRFAKALLELVTNRLVALEAPALEATA